VPLAGVDPRVLRVADSPNLRPTRDARNLLAANPTPRAISRRPTPGDFVRELAVDNKTTIPSPWLRRGRSNADGRGGRDSQERAFAARPGSRPASPTEPRAGAAREAGERDTGSLRRDAFRRESTPNPRAGREAQGAGGETRRPSAERTERAQPREAAPREIRRSEPRQQTGRRSESSDDGGSRRPQAERSGRSERSSRGDGTRSGGGSHAVARPPRNRQ
jgi:hypothetical protein